MKNNFFILIILSLLLLLPLVSAEKVGVGIYVLNLGKFDAATGSFTADFYLSMKCVPNCSSNFEFMNGRASSFDKMDDLPNERFYRIQANLNSPVDLKGFPFDKQKMQIILEDKDKTVEELEFIPLKEESGVDDSISFVGWNMDDWTVESRTHEYRVYNETYSQYVFSIDISRIFINSFLKTFLPVLFTVLIVMCTFIMDPDKIATRLTMTSSALIATVMFHISIANQIPPVGYLTLADKFMMLTYSIILFAVVINITLLELLELKKQDLVEKIHRATEYTMFIVIPLIYFAFFYFFI